jgi:ribosomal protein S18 acetylase RimI-like enzyme
MLKVDRASDTEREIVAAVTLEAYNQYAPQMDPALWAGYQANIRDAILTKSATIILIAKETENTKEQEKEAIKGSVLFVPPMSGRVKVDLPEMRLLAVAPQYRQLGIADLLIKECEQMAKSSGALTLHTTDLMQTAKAMYERRGYMRFPEIDFEPGPGFFVWGYKKMLTP